MPVSTLQFDPNSDGSCRVCRGALEPETWLCTRCGAAHGERNRCPHCRSIARTLPHATLHHRCSVCGRPRLLPGLWALTAASETQYQLQSAGQAQRIGTVIRYIGLALLLLGLPGLLLTAIILLILMPGVWLSAIALAFALLPLIFWLFLRSRATASFAMRDQKLQQIYTQTTLTALQRSGLERDSESLSRLLGLSTSDTEQLLLHLNADERMTSRVTDEGTIVYGAIDPDRRRIQALDNGPRIAEPESIVDGEFAEGDSPEERLRRQP